MTCWSSSANSSTRRYPVQAWIVACAGMVWAACATWNLHQSDRYASRSRHTTPAISTLTSNACHRCRARRHVAICLWRSTGPPAESSYRSSRTRRSPLLAPSCQRFKRPLLVTYTGSGHEGMAEAASGFVQKTCLQSSGTRHIAT